METNNWRVVCHRCATKFPHNAGFATKGACCDNPDFHVHNTSVNHMCGLCADEDSPGFILTTHIFNNTGMAPCGRAVFQFRPNGEGWAPRDQLRSPLGSTQTDIHTPHKMTITCPKCLRIDNGLEEGITHVRS